MAYPNHSFHFTIHPLTKSTRIQSSIPGLFSIYNEELIQLSPSPTRILLATDIDNTIYTDRENKTEIKEAYKRFVHYWITHYEFNGSKLVYNTGRNLSEYNKDLDVFFEPDLLISLLSNYVYKFDENGVGIEQDSFRVYIKDATETDWDTSLLSRVLVERFPCLEGYQDYISAFNVCFFVPSALFDSISKELLSFVQNNENLTFNGICFKGKTIVTSQGNKDMLYIEVVPKFLGKGIGLKFAQSLFGFTDRETLVAGDSLNDKDALKHSVWGVIVGNAENSLLEWYRKKERPLTWVSEFTYADAVVDGLNRVIRSISEA